jgi:hypothetical protein
VLVPSNFKELFDLLCSSANASVAAAAQQDQHVLQVRLAPREVCIFSTFTAVVALSLQVYAVACRCLPG